MASVDHIRTYPSTKSCQPIHIGRKRAGAVDDTSCRGDKAASVRGNVATVDLEVLDFAYELDDPVSRACVSRYPPKLNAELRRGRAYQDGSTMMA
jgi:hypothetical protein